jgi:hypothetical protein
MPFDASGDHRSDLRAEICCRVRSCLVSMPMRAMMNVIMLLGELAPLRNCSLMACNADDEVFAVWLHAIAMPLKSIAIASGFTPASRRRLGKKPDHKAQKDRAKKVHPRGHYQQYQPKESSREEFLFDLDNKRNSFRPLQHFGALLAWWNHGLGTESDLLAAPL